MAGGGAPGSNSRGRGGKFRKFTRGGGKHYSRNLRPLDADGNEISMWSEGAKPQDGDEEGSDEEEEEDSEEDSEDEGKAGDQSREDRKKEKKARKDAAIAKAKKAAVQVGDMPSDSDSDSEDEESAMPANPNHTKAARSQTKAPPVPVDDAAEGVAKLKVSGTPSRRERESMEAQQAKERYRQMHEAGKTDEAKADLARLRLIREKRETESARRQAEKEELEEAAKIKKQEIDAKESKKREAALGKPVKKSKN